jgi:hypothetical protein
MPMLRKLIALAVTTGLAKKAWDAYRGTSPKAASGSNWRRRSTDTASSGPVASGRRDEDASDRPFGR